MRNKRIKRAALVYQAGVAAETGDVVDQYGRGFRQVGGKLVPSGRLYFRTETTARPQ